MKRGGKIEDKDLFEALVFNSRKKNTEMEIQIDDDDSVDMSESAGTPLSKTKSITKNYAVKHLNFRKTRLKVIIITFSNAFFFSHQQSLIICNPYRLLE
jgi:hypothetical protein